jgi:hypothetical protein
LWQAGLVISLTLLIAFIFASMKEIFFTSTVHVLQGSMFPDQPAQALQEHVHSPSPSAAPPDPEPCHLTDDDNVPVSTGPIQTIQADGWPLDLYLYLFSSTSISIWMWFYSLQLKFLGHTWPKWFETICKVIFPRYLWSCFRWL